MLYKYCDSDGFDILINTKLKMSRVDDFNDLFDLAFNMGDDTALENFNFFGRWSI